MGGRMIDLREAVRTELDELEKAVAPVSTARLAERVERTLSARRRARAINRAGALAAVFTVAIVLGLGARRSQAVDMTSEIAKEPASPSQQPTIPTERAESPTERAEALTERAATPTPTEAIAATTDPARATERAAPRGRERAEPTPPRDHEKPSAEPGADALLERALAARGGKDPKTATGLLESLRAAHPGTSQAAIAAAYLGRDAARGGQPEAARRWLKTYLQEQPSGPLEREASGQLIELTTGSEQTERARAYLAHHPNGPHAPLATRVLAGTR